MDFIKNMAWIKCNGWPDLVCKDPLMSKETYKVCRICDVPRILIDGIFCDSCYELIEHISNYYGEINHRFNQTTKGK